MPRKVTKSLERPVAPDRKYQSVLVQRLINKSMLDGKKNNRFCIFPARAFCGTYVVNFAYGNGRVDIYR